jgi:hypothetical protein
MPLSAMLNPALLPYETVTGDRPPTLPDYLDDEVSGVVREQATYKLVLIQATEVSVSSS